MTSPSAAVIFMKAMNGGGNSCVESSTDESYGFNWRSSGGSVRTEKGVVNGETCVLTKNDHFFVRALDELLMRKKSEA